MQDEIDVNRLVRIDTDNALEDLQETYDFNADEATLDELTEILDAFTAIIPSWYYYGWSQKDVSDGAFHSE
jgi:ABC-type oligopeptide transport system substrate-binding subunit